ncbi:MAG TPA: hypothetical protein GX723_07715 [Thermoanaerobacterales bacterium]|nr:hypothetical protein [Thermoanaerobacterales bacterium]
MPKAEGTRERMRQNFSEFLKIRGIKNEEAVDMLYPFIISSSRISKIKKGATIPFEVLVVLHYEFGIDLNEFIAGDTQESSIMLSRIQDILCRLPKLLSESTEFKEIVIAHIKDIL